MNECLHDLSALFRTKERIKLLRTTLSLPVCTVKQVTTRTGLSKGLVSQYLALLEHEGLLERINRKYQLKICPLTSALKRLLNVDLVSTVFKKPSWSRGIGIYGSWADGTNTDESDLDLFIFSETLPSGIMIAEVERDVSRALSREVHVLVLTPEKITGMKKSDEPFYQSFMKQSITLAGDPYDSS